MSANTSRSTSGHDGVGPIACRSCDLNEICRLSGLIAIESGRRRHSSGALRTVRAGTTLFRSGAPAHSLYAVRQGMLKTVRTSVDGDERILALHIPGEVLGLEAFGAGTYACDAVALQTSVCCELPLPLFGEYGARVHELGSALIRLLSRATVPGLNLTRGSVRQRITSFLLDLAQRLERRDLDGRRFSLGLTRQEIADLVDTRIETVSRMLQQLNREQLIRLRGDKVSLLALTPVDESAGAG
jgi:CRP/FNR family transcriptional regulator, anaerobic regulatory protein